MKPNRIISIFLAAALLVSGSVSYAGDLFSKYMDNDRTVQRGQLSYDFGVGVPAPFPEGQGGDVLSFSAGIERKSCGALNLASEIKGIFNAEELNQYITGLAASVVSGAPLLLLCYASQTLCDLYKHFRNMANAALSIRQRQCSAIESLAANAGTSLRNNSIMRCISENMGSMSYDEAVNKCGQIEPTAEIPGTGVYQTSYNLTDAIATQIGGDSDINNFIKGVLGDVTFSATVGIANSTYPRFGEESKVSNLTNQFYDATKSTIEGYVNGGGMPDAGTLKLISIPGFPMNPLVLTKLRSVDPITRDDFYRQYSSVAAMTTMLYKMEDAIDAIAAVKSAAKDKDTIQKDEDLIKKLEIKYDLLNKQLALQKDYLLPMFNTLMAYQPVGKEAAPTDAQQKAGMLHSILKTQQP